MEHFSRGQPIACGPINLYQPIHQAVETARARQFPGVRFAEDFDPSLPLVHGNHDALVQILAQPRDQRLRSARRARRGYRAADDRVSPRPVDRQWRRGAGVSRCRSRSASATMVRGVPADIRGDLFDPFVTTKREGRGSASRSSPSSRATWAARSSIFATANGRAFASTCPSAQKGAIGMSRRQDNPAGRGRSGDRDDHPRTRWSASAGISRPVASIAERNARRLRDNRPHLVIYRRRSFPTATASIRCPAPGSIPTTPVIVLSAAEHARHRGACDGALAAMIICPKPFDLDELTASVRAALERRAEPAPPETRRLPRRRSRARSGARSAMQSGCTATIARLASSDLAVLIHGGSGTGKGSRRACDPRDGAAPHRAVSSAINMAAIPRELIEAELFGHEKGALHRCAQPQRRTFRAGCGQDMLFLDEIGDMPLEAQTRQTPARAPEQ